MCLRVWWSKNLLFGAVSAHKQTVKGTAQGHARKLHAERSKASTERVRTWAQPSPCAVTGTGYASKRDGPES